MYVNVDVPYRADLRNDKFAMEYIFLVIQLRPQPFVSVRRSLVLFIGAITDTAAPGKWSPKILLTQKKGPQTLLRVE